MGRFLTVLAGIALVALLACTPPPPTPVPLETLDNGVNGGTGPILVMLHGYGSRPEDLIGFAQRTDFPVGTEVVLPRAPEPTMPPRGPLGGRMWWQFPDDFHDLRTRHPAGMTEAARAVSALLDRIDPAQRRPLVIGGFSQGAMLALEVALSDRRPLAGLVLLSGTLVDRADTTTRLSSRAHLPVYVSHGTRDDVLPYPYTVELVALMRAAQLDVRFTSFDGAHEVTRVVSEEAAAFVREVSAR